MLKQEYKRKEVVQRKTNASAIKFLSPIGLKSPNQEDVVTPQLARVA